MFRKLAIATCAAVCVVSIVILPAAAAQGDGCTKDADCTDCIASPCASGKSQDIRCFEGVCQMECDRD